MAEHGSEEWGVVLQSLEDPQWDFRTVKGIAEETGLEQNHVANLLAEHRSQVYQTVSRKWGLLYKLKSRPMKWNDYLADIQMFASKSF